VTIVERVRGFFERHRIAPSRIVVACSGGVDSTALLLALSELGYPIVCGHVNHHLRGEESDADEAFVRALCARLGVALEVRDGSLDNAAVRRSGVEAAARDLRQARLQEIRAAVGAEYIATAHQKNDQAETVVMRLITGTGLAGLRGIHPVREDGFIRPLLDVTRGDIVAFLAERGVTPRLDRMNEDRRFLRNRVRAALKDLGPGAVDSIAAVASQAQQLWPYVEKAIDRAEHVEASRDETRFLDWPADPWMRQAILQRHIRRLDEHSRDVSAADLERLAASIDSIKRVNVTKSLELIRRGDTLVLRHVPRPSEDFEVTIRPGERTYVPQINATIMITEHSAPSTEHCFTLRNRRPGDRFGRKKLKDLLIDRKIAAELRDRIPLLVWNDEIVWVGGVGVSDRFKHFEVVLEHASQEDQDGLQRQEDRAAHRSAGQTDP
jgi:tRNA(Ile)-lysidine synthase